MEYYGALLNPNEQQFYKEVVDVLFRRLSFAKAKGIVDEDTLLKCISAVEFDYPELYYVDFRKITYARIGNNLEYRPSYCYTGKQTEKITKRLDDIISGLRFEMDSKGFCSLYQRCGYIHAYLVRTCTYDYDALDSETDSRKAYNIEGPLLEHKGVCQGIAFAYRYICKRLGINAITARGVSLKPGTRNYERHAWNIVMAAGQAAHIDTTWDICMTSDGMPIRYDYFLLPDIDMMRDHQYVGYPICRKLSLTYYERNGSQFTEIYDLENYVTKTIKGQMKDQKPGICYVQFKLANRKYTMEEITAHVMTAVGRCTRGPYKCYGVANPQQSVYTYKIEL